MGGEPTDVSTAAPLRDLAKAYQHLFKFPILLAKVDNELWELHKKLNRDCRVTFLDMTDPHGYRAYQRSAVFLMLCAAKEVLGRHVRIVVAHSINKNYYCEIPDDDIELTEALLRKIEKRMTEMVGADVPIEKV